MTQQQILDAMGSTATESEAAEMTAILAERGIDSLDQISDAEFFALIPEAVRRSEKKAMTLSAKTPSDEFIRRALGDPAGFGLDRCLLCDGVADVIGKYVPGEAYAKRMGQKPGKQRVIVYGLCRLCTENPDWGDRIEAQFLHALEAQMNQQETEGTRNRGERRRDGRCRSSPRLPRGL